MGAYCQAAERICGFNQGIKLLLLFLIIFPILCWCHFKYLLKHLNKAGNTFITA